MWLILKVSPALQTVVVRCFYLILNILLWLGLYVSSVNMLFPCPLNEFKNILVNAEDCRCLEYYNIIASFKKTNLSHPDFACETVTEGWFSCPSWNKLPWLRFLMLSTNVVYLIQLELCFVTTSIDNKLPTIGTNGIPSSIWITE